MSGYIHLNTSSLFPTLWDAVFQVQFPDMQYVKPSINQRQAIAKKMILFTTDFSVKLKMGRSLEVFSVEE